MKYTLLIGLLAFCSCTEKIEHTLDPVSKTEMVLKAIQTDKHEQIREAFFDVGDNPQTKEALFSMDTIIRNELKKYGFPKKSQITFKQERKAVPEFYKKSIPDDSVTIVTTTVQLNTDPEKTVEIVYLKKESDLEILYFQ